MRLRVIGVEEKRVAKESEDSVGDENQIGRRLQTRETDYQELDSSMIAMRRGLD